MKASGGGEIGTLGSRQTHDALCATSRPGPWSSRLDGQQWSCAGNGMWLQADPANGAVPYGARHALTDWKWTRSMRRMKGGEEVLGAGRE